MHTVIVLNLNNKAPMSANKAGHGRFL